MTDQRPEPESPATARADPRAARSGWPASVREKWGTLPARSRGLVAGGVAAALLAVGIAGGAAGASFMRPEPATFEAGLAGTPITRLAAGERVALDGKVVEIFGNKFVVDDGTARALVETGPAGEGGDLVAIGEAVTVQGRFEHGFVHASALRHGDGAIEELAPLPPPPHGRP